MLRWMGHLGRCEPPFHLFSLSFPPFGTEWVQAAQHPALIHARLTAFRMSLIHTQPLEELLGSRVLCCRVPERTGGGAAGQAGEGEAIIQARNRKGGHFKSVYILFSSFNVEAICPSVLDTALLYCCSVAYGRKTRGRAGRGSEI